MFRSTASNFHGKKKNISKAEIRLRCWKNFQRRSLTKFSIENAIVERNAWGETIQHAERKKKLHQTGESDEKKLSNLFSNDSIENMKSSQLLKHMWCHLEPHKLPENILRQLWLYELPNNVTQILIPCLEQNLRKCRHTQHHSESD